jgi:hypothetical protein
MECGGRSRRFAMNIRKRWLRPPHSKTARARVASTFAVAANSRHGVAARVATTRNAARSCRTRCRRGNAAQSNFHDVVPANAMGVPTAWVNRRGEAPRDGGIPTYEVRDLTGLADLFARS